MNKVFPIVTLIASASAELSWGVRCEFASAGCSDGLLSCAQFKLVDGCANDGTAFALNGSSLTVEEGACSADRVASISSNAMKIESGKCLTLAANPTLGTETRYVKYFATNDGSASLRDYTLSDLAECSGNLVPKASSDLFLDSYSMHDDPFQCTLGNTLNRFSYVSRNRRCDAFGVYADFDAESKRLVVSEFTSRAACESQSEVPTEYYYLADGSCHIGMYQSVSANKLRAHVGLCGEPAVRVVDDKPGSGSGNDDGEPSVCGVPAQPTQNGAASSASSVVAVVLAAAVIATRA